MLSDDTDRDPLLQRHLVLLSRHEPTPSGLTDRVVRDLENRGLVRRSPTVAPRWVAAAAAIFALGAAAGGVVAARRIPTVQPSSRAVVDRIAVEVNVPSPGKSEVWF